LRGLVVVDNFDNRLGVVEQDAANGRVRRVIAVCSQQPHSHAAARSRRLHVNLYSPRNGNNTRTHTGININKTKATTNQDYQK